MALRLPTRPLGENGPQITSVGLGAWAIGGGDWAFGWGPQADDDSIAAIHRALDLGVTWIDTAGAYGLGHSEEVVRRALRGMAEPPLLFTKCGMVWHDQADGVPRPNLRPEEIRRQCDDSLRRLGVERIDLLQFHWPDTTTGTPIEESWGVMAELVGQGKVRWAGVSNFDVDMLERCEPIRHVDSLQPPFNAIDRAAGDALLPWCVSHGTGVIAYSPMMSGLLTGRFSLARAQALDDTDWRKRFAAFVAPELSRNLALAGPSSRSRRGTTPPSRRWPWRGCSRGRGSPRPSSAARAPGQVDGWIGAADLRLDDADLDDIASAIAATGAGAGPVRPNV